MARMTLASPGPGRSGPKRPQTTAKRAPAKPIKVQNGKSAKRAINSHQRLYEQKAERDRIIISKFEELQLKERIRGQKRHVKMTEVFEATRLKNLRSPKARIDLRRVQQLWKEIQLVFAPEIRRRRLKRCKLVNEEPSESEINRIYNAARYFGY